VVGDWPQILRGLIKEGKNGEGKRARRGLKVAFFLAREEV